jgi:lactoylglutathione lyase
MPEDEIADMTMSSEPDGPSWQKELGAISLFVDDLAKAKAFYVDVFELPLLFEDATSAVFKLANTMINLLVSPAALELIAPAAVAAKGAGSRCQLSIFVEDVDTVCTELGDRGVELINGPMDRAWGMRTACFADPDGHLWEVAQDLD